MKTLVVLGYVTRETRSNNLSPIKDASSKDIETVSCERSDGTPGFTCYKSAAKDPLFTYVEE
jgi:hypothetical protein